MSHRSKVSDDHICCGNPSPQSVCFSRDLFRRVSRAFWPSVVQEKTSYLYYRIQIAVQSLICS